MGRMVLGLPCRAWLAAGVMVSMALVPVSHAQQSDPPAQLLRLVLEHMIKEEYQAANDALVDQLEFRPKFADLVVQRFKEKTAELGEPRSYWIERRVARPYRNDGQGRIVPNTVNVRAIIEYEHGWMWETVSQFYYADHRWNLTGVRFLSQWREEPVSAD